MMEEEHNHSRLAFGFLLSFFMFGLGISLAFIGRSGADLQSQLVVTVFALLMIISSIYMIRKTIQKKNNCPICEKKYRFGKKKNE